MDIDNWLGEVKSQYDKYRKMCEAAAAQLNDEQFFARPDSSPHSVAILMKHLGGNHRSRWRDFLTTDGEKEDRNRETEFDVANDTRASIESLWQQGWRMTNEALDGLTANDMERIITIRGEAHSVVQAIQRNLTHLAYHTGQLVMLARSLKGPGWQFLSIPPGKSDDYNTRMRDRHGDW